MIILRESSGAGRLLSYHFSDRSPFYSSNAYPCSVRKSCRGSLLSSLLCTRGEGFGLGCSLALELLLSFFHHFSSGICFATSVESLARAKADATSALRLAGATLSTLRESDGTATLLAAIESDACICVPGKESAETVSTVSTCLTLYVAALISLYLKTAACLDVLANFICLADRSDCHSIFFYRFSTDSHLDERCDIS